MPLKSARRLPRRYNRPVSARSRALAERRRGYHKQMRRERLRRLMRRVHRIYLDWQQFVLRWFAVGVAIALVVIMGFLLFSPLVRVRTIHVRRTDQRLDIEQAQHALAPLFGRHTMFLSQMEVLTLLRGAVADLDQVQLRKTYPAEITVTVALAPLVARAEVIGPDDPPGMPETGTGVVALYLSRDGMLIATALPQDADLPRIRLVDWGARPRPGDPVLPPEFFLRMREAEAQLKAQFSLHVTERTVFLRGQEFHVRVRRGDGESGGREVVLWFDMRSSVEEHIHRYRTLLRALGQDAASEYIYLRLHERVVYK